MIILGIETSCDETAASICKDGKILTNIVSQQIIHKKFGGVVPEIASRQHEILLNRVVDTSLKEAKININQIDAISVTQGPGLTGALLTGISFAKGLGLGLGIPVVPVNHLEGHIFANFLAEPSLEFPFVCLLVSGGHTQLWYIEGMEKYALLGETRDDAAGEAFDKGARILGLGYPGGPAIEKEAIHGNPNKYHFPRILLSKNSLDFSFSGLKTSILYFMDDFEKTKIKSLADVAASYQQAIVDTLVEKTRRAIDQTGADRCIIAGGVAANKCLRNKLELVLPENDILFPDFSLCTDNAAMISYLGQLKFQSKIFKKMNFSAIPNLKLV
ncbi:MAG: tRNA (adenosine(37)-N6)-threonylcarbamoyltransferase complex transferase subunit TsaD [bacterium TMED46]|nr:MAG: tRNA (adenosine(37)-N6)-threonylcarbamoyltransferase complex transferase subunit TsaD [bacterium TMED46]|tara:strand:- start:4352 stop:5341 length:990 start_codon:yes stop_codon:yes gene_type:complete